MSSPPHKLISRRAASDALKSSLKKRNPSFTPLCFAYLAALLFLVGIFAPSFTMIPKFGDGFFERLVRLFVSSDLEPRQFSLVGGILHLFQEGQLFIGGLILLFSLAFPLAKLIALIRAIHLGSRATQRHLKMVESLGKWSMVDVFVIASLVICFKGFPGGTHIQVQWGIYIFAISILLSMWATYILKQQFHPAAAVNLTSGAAADLTSTTATSLTCDAESSGDHKML
ncbi:MAG TPA: paraquat-inducible protein A [Pirellulales bacterium]|nr:paraquat-inducible protein A [Pirellulales bacterium]